MSITIGNVVFGNRPVFLAPMEDVTDKVFRMMCRELGADMVYTEFVSSDALVRRVNKSIRKLSVAEQERPAVIQIYGKDPGAMAEAAQIAEEQQPEIIDINFGCPVNKIAKKGAGSGLLRDVPLMLEITRRVVNAVKTPVTVKTRLGWDERSKIITDIALPLQDTGIVALTLHGRTREQMYTGKADWETIAKVKELPGFTIPLIGNGDIQTPEDAQNAFSKYGVDAIMIGRAAIGSPWLFNDVRQFLDTGSVHTPLSVNAKFEILKKLVAENCRQSGEKGGILHTRRHLAATTLLKGLHDFKPLRIELLRAETEEHIFDLLDRIRDKYFA